MYPATHLSAGATAGSDGLAGGIGIAIADAISQVSRGVFEPHSELRAAITPAYQVRPSRGQRVEASRFGIALDRLGGLSKRQVEPAFVEAPKHCAEPANEQLMFCTEVKKAVGW